MNDSWFRIESRRDLITVTIHAQPGAKRNEVAGIHGDALKIRIAAAPVDGKANAELIAFIAEIFEVPMKQVRLIRGQTGRHKTVEITGSKKHPLTLVPKTNDS